MGQLELHDSSAVLLLSFDVTAIPTSNIPDHGENSKVSADPSGTQSSLPNILKYAWKVFPIFVTLSPVFLPSTEALISP